MWLKWFWQILLDEWGQEGPAAGGEGQGGAPADGGEGASPGAGEGEGAGGEGQGAEPPVTPAFGDFGDTPTTLEEATALLQKIYGEHTKLKPEFETLKGKTAATERNLALTRQALEGSGIRAIPKEDGTIGLEVVSKPQEKKIRFNDEAINKLAYHFQNDPRTAREFVDLIRLAIQDEMDSGFETRQQQYQEAAKRQTIFNRFYDQATGLMFAHFPQIDGKWDASGKINNEAFDQAFHDKVMERVIEKYSDGRGRLTNPQGELLAALEVAQELGITAQVVSKAKQEGFQAGKSGKKILAPVAGGGKGGAAKGGRLSFAEYDKLSPEEKKKYDENWKEA